MLCVFYRFPTPFPPSPPSSQYVLSSASTNQCPIPLQSITVSNDIDGALLGANAATEGGEEEEGVDASSTTGKTMMIVCITFSTFSFDKCTSLSSCLFISSFHSIYSFIVITPSLSLSLYILISCP